MRRVLWLGCLVAAVTGPIATGASCDVWGPVLVVPWVATGGLALAAVLVRADSEQRRTVGRIVGAVMVALGASLLAIVLSFLFTAHCG